MDPTDVLARGRAFQLRTLNSVVRIRRATGRKERHPVTGRELPTWTVVHEAEPFRLAGPSRGAATSETLNIADGTTTLARRVGKFRHDLRDLRSGDLVEVVDGEWVGTVWRLGEAIGQDGAIARRIPVTQVARPAEWDQE
ncbi:hypothetical protein GCM10022215_24190 [Nocardioides fonticola]|uniref:ASCH domain-containing protein n=1 Tax=Nocardioides fonticola TaxID=450363 RepID=A0ABP7XKT7_9ACTN